MPIIETVRNRSFGWSTETTPHLPVIVQRNSALREDRPLFVVRNYDLWNVRTAMIDPADARLVTALLDRGFTEVATERGTQHGLARVRERGVPGGGGQGVDYTVTNHCAANRSISTVFALPGRCACEVGT